MKTITEEQAYEIVEERVRRLNELDEKYAAKGLIDLAGARKDEPLVRKLLYDLVKAQYNVIK